MISHQEAKRFATEHLRAEGSQLIAKHATRDRRFGVWVVAYRDPATPDEMLDGGGLVVTDEGEVCNVGSTPDAVERLMMDLGREPGAEPGDVYEREGESLALLADEDPDEAAGLAAWAESRRPWPGALDGERAKPYFADLMRYIDRERATHRNEVYPASSEMFAAFHLTALEKIKVVILGQDPYPNPGQATGLCFSVPKNLRPPTSMVNIHAAMRFDGLTPPEHGDLTGWAKQGVFLLNTALTVPRNGQGRHVSAWKPFTDAVIRLVSDREGPPIVFVLWGRKAQKKKGLINTDRHGLIEAPHPAAHSGDAQTRFRQARTFSKVNKMLQEFGSKPINWTPA